MTSPIVPLDPAVASDATLADVYALRHACHRAIAPDDPYSSVGEWSSLIRLLPAHIRRWHWITDGGYACLMRTADSGAANAEIVVAAGHRRRGIGSALVETVRAHAISVGCHSIVGRYADGTGAAFAEALGAHPANSQIRSVLSLDTPLTMPPDVSGYLLRSWERAPQDLLASYARARNAINDAPHTEGEADEDCTPQMVRDIEDTLARRGRQVRVTAALDADSDVAAYTEIRLSPDLGATAMTEETAVQAAHRGRGLAGWVKVESLRRLRADRPDVRLVVTSNDATNAAMLRVNQRVGFRPAAVWTDAVLKIR